MWAILRIRRRVSGAPGPPDTLLAAELAFNEVDLGLYYGAGVLSDGQTAAAVIRINAPPVGEGDHYFHSQVMPAANWVIAHGLGRYPSVVVVDSAGSMVEGDVHYDTPNQVILSFGAPFAGTASLS